MARVAIIGGGAAGLGAVKVLVDAGLDVTLFEELPRLGGTARGRGAARQAHGAGRCRIVRAGEASNRFLIVAAGSTYSRPTVRGSPPWGRATCRPCSRCSTAAVNRSRARADSRGGDRRRSVSRTALRRQRARRGAGAADPRLPRPALPAVARSRDRQRRRPRRSPDRRSLSRLSRRCETLYILAA